MEQFKRDILYHAICLEQESDFLGYLTDLAKWCIANQGACVNEKTPAILKDEIINAIDRLKKLKILLTELARAGYTPKGGQQYPDYDFYRNYFRKSIAGARSALRKLNPYLTTFRVVPARFVLGEISPGY